LRYFLLMALPSPTSMSFNPLLIAAIAGSVLAVLWLRRRAPAQRHNAARWLSLLAAGLLLSFAWTSPVATVSQHYLLSAHLLQITLVMGVVPPLLLLSLPRYPRVRVPRPLGAALRALVHPLPAVLGVNAAFFLWHLAGPYDAAGADWRVDAAMQLSLFAASIAFWWPIVTPLSPPVRSMTPLGKLGYILLATIPQTFGGLIVALAHHPLYATYVPAPRLFGIGVLSDQQIAGACIALVSKVSLFAAFFVIFMRALQPGTPEGDEDGGGGGSGPRRDAPLPIPSGTPRWLHELERGRTVPEPTPPRVRVPAASGPGRG
jgi:cytochrome c oxidase assembly factor CtaG